MSNHLRLCSYVLEVPSWQVHKLVPLPIYGCFRLRSLHRLIDGEGTTHQAVVELRHKSCFGHVVHLDLVRWSFLSPAVAEQRGFRVPWTANRHAPGFPPASLLGNTRHFRKPRMFRVFLELRRSHQSFTSSETSKSPLCRRDSCNLDCSSSQFASSSIWATVRARLSLVVW